MEFLPKKFIDTESDFLQKVRNVNPDCSIWTVHVILCDQRSFWGVHVHESVCVGGGRWDVKTGLMDVGERGVRVREVGFPQENISPSTTIESIRK